MCLSLMLDDDRTLAHRVGGVTSWVRLSLPDPNGSGLFQDGADSIYAAAAVTGNVRFSARLPNCGQPNS